MPFRRVTSSLIVLASRLSISQSFAAPPSSSTNRRFLTNQRLYVPEFMSSIWAANSDEEGDFSQLVDSRGCQAFEVRAVNDQEKWLRVQAKPDLPDMSKEEILQRIQQVQEQQGAYGPSDLYQRRWIPITTASPAQNDDSTFSILQFNILAQGLSFGPNTQSPFEPTQKLQEYKAKNTYGGFTSVLHPEICLDFELRQWRLLQAILDADCDVICLEEIDRYHGFFLPMLQKFGYEGHFVCKAHSPGVKLGWYSDGCAIFYRSNVFQLQGVKRQEYNVGNQVCLVASLKHIASKQIVQVASTHLKAKHQQECEVMRQSQVNQLLHEILVDKESTKNTANVLPTICAGDFNAEPQSESVQMMLQAFRSAYDLNSDANFVTTCKTRGNDTIQRVIDYIFYSKGISCTALLSIPREEIQKEKLPSLRYPSDHVLIAAKFAFTKPTE